MPCSRRIEPRRRWKRRRQRRRGWRRSRPSARARWQRSVDWLVVVVLLLLLLTARSRFSFCLHSLCPMPAPKALHWTLSAPTFRRRSRRTPRWSGACRTCRPKSKAPRLFMRAWRCRTRGEARKRRKAAVVAMNEHVDDCSLPRLLVTDLFLSGSRTSSTSRSPTARSRTSA